MKKSILVAMMLVLVPVANAAVVDGLEFVNDKASLNLVPQATTAGALVPGDEALTWLGYAGDGQRIWARAVTHSSGHMNFHTNNVAQTGTGGFAYTHFGSTVTSFGSVEMEFLVKNTGKSVTGCKLRLLVRDDGGKWYTSAADDYTEDTTVLVNATDTTWAEITDATSVAALEDTTTCPTAALVLPADGALGAFPAINATGGGLYLEGYIGGGTDGDRPDLRMIKWDVAIATADVPYVEGLTLADATTALTGVAPPFVVDSATRTAGKSWWIPAGSVLDQDPEGPNGQAGEVEAGTTVLLQLVDGLPDGHLWTGAAANNKIEDAGNWSQVGATPPSWPPTDAAGSALRIHTPGTYELSTGSVTLRALSLTPGANVVVRNGATLNTGAGGGSGIPTPDGPGEAIGSVTVDEGGTVTALRPWQIGNGFAFTQENAGLNSGWANGELIVNGSFTTDYQIFLGGNGGGATYASNQSTALLEIGGNATVTAGRNMQVRTNLGIVRFVGDADSFGTVAQTHGPHGARVFAPGGTLEINTTAYTGGDASWDIITWIGTVDETTNGVLLADWVAAAKATLPDGWNLVLDPTAGAGKITLIKGDGGGGGGTTEGTPVAGMLGLGLVAAACAIGGAMVIRKKN